MTLWRFRKHQHLRSSSEFECVYQQRCRASDRNLLIYVAPNETSSTNNPCTRIGLSVSRKQGNAVVRNRIKRLMREVFRLSQHELPAGYDLILIPRAGSGSTLADYRRSLKRLTKKLISDRRESER